MELRTLASCASSHKKPSIIVAIQKEMFLDHFFSDKMEKIEPLPREHPEPDHSKSG